MNISDCSYLMLSLYYSRRGAVNVDHQSSGLLVSSDDILYFVSSYGMNDND